MEEIPKQSVSNRDKIKDLLEKLRTHKKASAVFLSAIFLLIVIIVLVIQTFRTPLLRFFGRETDEQHPNLNQSAAQPTGRMTLSTNKTRYSLNEKISVKVVADSNAKVVTAFDAMISYDSEIVTPTDKRIAGLDTFNYFNFDDGRRFTISAVQKENVKEDQILRTATIYEIEFLAKKPGKVLFHLVFSPSSKNESNIISKESEDILVNVNEKQIEIQ